MRAPHTRIARIALACAVAIGAAVLNHAMALPPVRAGGVLPMQRHVSTQPAFVLFKPAGWKVGSEGAGGTLRIIVSDAAGTSRAETAFAPNPQGRYNTLAFMSESVPYAAVPKRRGRTEARVKTCTTPPIASGP